jgi:hypothetical protein
MTKKRRIKSKKNRRMHIIAMGAVFALAMMFVFALLFWPGCKDPQEGTTIFSAQEESGHYRHPVTGVWLETPLSSLPRVFGVMVDEHEDAQPLSGVDQAFLVIEAPTEAGIPRLLAFFTDEQSVEKIGPVRSARPYFIEWAQMFDALYAHVGGSPQALEQLAREDVIDLNQYWNGSFFWRSSDRDAPHNVFTSTDLLSSFVEGEDDPVYETWSFRDTSQKISEEVTEVTLDFSIYAWGDSTWRFDTSSKRYQRFLGEDIYSLEDGASVFADNVVILFTDVEIVDDIGRRDIRTVGEGEGYLLQEGMATPIVWKRPQETNIPRFYTEDGTEYALLAGVTWIEVLPGPSSITTQLP